VIDGPPNTKRPHPTAPSWITTPTDGSVIAPLSGSYLTLTTCHPKGSAAKRLIVRAVLRSA
jgi:sortase A